jgi:hypothetical protein
MTRIRLAYINEFIDRHGKLRRYVRRPGMPRVPIHGAPGSAEFMAEYQAALAAAPPPLPSRHNAGTLGALAEEYFRAPELVNLRRAPIEACSSRS